MAMQTNQCPITHAHTQQLSLSALLLRYSHSGGQKKLCMARAHSHARHTIRTYNETFPYGERKQEHTHDHKRKYNMKRLKRQPEKNLNHKSELYRQR